MIILRTLLLASVTANVILNPLDSRKGALDGIAIGLFSYMNIQKLVLNIPIWPSVGIVTPPPPATPFPGIGTLGVDFVVPALALLQDKLDLYTRDVPLLSPKGMTGMFTAIGEWLNAPPPLCNVLPAGIPMVTSVGASAITFPLMATLGTPCFATMVGLGILGIYPLGQGPIEYLVGQFEILSDFIYLGLAGNVIPPLPTTALYTGLPYVGTTTVPVWLLLDVPQWPITTDGSTGFYGDAEVTYSDEIQVKLDDIFNQLGIDQDKLTCFTFSDELSNSALADECSILFDEEAQQYIIPTSGDCSTIDTSAYDNVNSDYDEMKDSADGLDQGEELVEDTSYKGELTFTVITPVIKTEYNQVFIGDGSGTDGSFSNQNLFTTGG